MEYEGSPTLAGMRRILVLGASGFLGNYLWKHYSANGWEVVGTSYAASNERFLKFDIADRASFEDLLREVSPEVVINASGYINGIAEQAAGIKNSVEGQSAAVIDLARACVRNKVRLFLTMGSSAEYGEINHNSITEATEYGELTPYGLMKRITTESLASLDSDETQIIVLRPFLVFGFGQKFPRLTPLILQNMDNVKFLMSLSLTDCKDFIAVGDFVRIVSRLVDKKIYDIEKRFDVLNVCSGEGVTIGDWINKIRVVYGRKEIESFAVRPLTSFVGSNFNLMHHIGPFEFACHENSIRTLTSANFGNH